MEALEFAKLNGVDGEANVTMPREPGAVMLIIRFRAVTDPGVFHVGVTAYIEDGGEFARAFLRHVEVPRRVQAGHGLVVEVLDYKLIVLGPTGDRRLEIGLFRSRGKSRHLEKLFA